jgi:5-methylcytosine-specific restriction endonuclease McrA
MKKVDREILFNKFDGKCAYCGNNLTKGWHADHITPIYRGCTDEELERYNKKRGSNELENFNPSCASCNRMKQDLSLDKFRDKIKQFVNSLNLYSTQYQFAKKYNLVEESDREVVFYFEK